MSRFSFSFSLKSFFLFVLVVGAGFGVWLSVVAPINQQWRAIHPLLDAGVSIETRSNGLPKWTSILFPSGQTSHIISADFNSHPVAVDAIRELRELPFLERLYLERADITDEHLREVAQLKSLRRISIWRTNVTDKGIKQLAKLPNLEFVDFHGTGGTWRSMLAFQQAGIECKFHQGSGLDVHNSEIDEWVKLKHKTVFLKVRELDDQGLTTILRCLLYTSPSPRDLSTSRMPSSA